MTTNLQTDPLPVNRAARVLGVPARWLRDECESGNLPCLRADRAILIHVPTVASMLAERAKRGAEVPDED
jgi:hypothetical protein